MYDFTYKGYDVKFCIAGFYEIFWKGILKGKASSKEEAKQIIDNF